MSTPITFIQSAIIFLSLAVLPDFALSLVHHTLDQQNSLEWSILVILLRLGHVICVLQTLHWFSILFRVKVPKFMFWPSGFFIFLKHFHSSFSNIPNHTSSLPSLLKEAHTLLLVDHSMWNILPTDFLLASSLTSCEASYLKFQSLFQHFTSSIPTLLFSPLHFYLDLLITH